MSDHQDCHALVVELSEYVEGCLNSDLCAELERHLQGCENCRIVVNTLRKTIELYHGDSGVVVELPEGMRERLFARLDLLDFIDKTE